jgi:hypothetical protein
MAKKTDTTASVLAEIAAYGAFLPGSVRKSTEKRTLKDGRVKEYEAQPIYTWTDPETGRQRCRRIPKAAYKHVRDLTLRHKGMKKLMARFEAAAVAENLDSDSKKNSSR